MRKNNLRAINGKVYFSEKPDDSKTLPDTFVILSQEELMFHKLAGSVPRSALHSSWPILTTHALGPRECHKNQLRSGKH